MGPQVQTFHGTRNGTVTVRYTCRTETIDGKPVTLERFYLFKGEKGESSDWYMMVCSREALAQKIGLDMVTNF